jgi:hypothetical protein
MSAELMPANTNPLVLRPHPFTQDPGVYPVRAGQTLQQMLDEAAQGEAIVATLRVEIGGIEVPRALWVRVRPKKGTAIHATVMPAGGGGSGNKTLRTVLLIVVLVVAWYAAPYLVAAYGGTAAAWAAGINLVGALLVNALIPPPRPSGLSGGNAGDAGRFNMLTGSSNQVNLYGAIPLVIGESRFFPPHAAMPYSETVGQTSYQRLMFDLGYGDLVVSDIKIGDTPIASFSEVQYEITTAPTLYTNDVNEVTVSATMNDLGDLTRTTSPTVDEISLDIVFPQGLFGADKKGAIVQATASLSIQYRLTGTTPWIYVPVTTPVTGAAPTRTSGFSTVGATMSGAQVKTGDRKPFAVSVAWGVAQGQYDVRVTRAATNWGSAEANSRVGDGTWTVLRSIRHTNPSTTGTTKLAMRIKASEQLNGTLQMLSCLVQQKIPVYNRTTSTWAAAAVNLNPAWVYYWLLNACPAITVKVPASRIDLNALADFADFCTTNNFAVRGVQDARTTARALLDEVLSGSLGALSLRDGKYGVIFDNGSLVPSMAFSPLDMRNLSVARAFVRMPHALKVRFRNPAANWDIDEVVVVDDGYSYRGVDAHGVTSAAPLPTEFETLELHMSSDAISAWRLARFHMAQAKYRPNTFVWETDVANLACTRGDLVYTSHDVTEWGDGWGRVKSLVGTALTLDEAIVTTGGSYNVRIRKNNGSTVVVGATPVGGAETNQFTLASAPSGVNVGDVAVAGQTSLEAKQLLITGITPSADLGARISAVEYDSRVAPYWSNPPVSIVSQITGRALYGPPDAPNITVIVSSQANSDPGDGGTTTPQVHIGVSRPSGYLAPAGGNLNHPLSRMF